MERGAVILIEDGELLLIERICNGQTYYLFPGGGVEVGETCEQAAIREAYEELGLQVAPGPLAAVVTHDQTAQYYFFATVLGGKFGTGMGAEFRSRRDSPEGSYRPVRLPLATLAEYDIRPRALAEALASHRLTPGDAVLDIDD